MLFHIERASDHYVGLEKAKPPISGALLKAITTIDGCERFHWIIEANSIEKLSELGKCARNEIIVNFNNDYWRMPTLLIYDDYIE